MSALSEFAEAKPAAVATASAARAHEGRGHDLRLDGISHRFGDFVAINEVRLEIRAGELIAPLGPSGCGKSTLLRIVSGFIRQSEGRVLFDNACVDHLPPNRRGVGIVFQNYAL